MIMMRHSRLLAISFLSLTLLVFPILVLAQLPGVNTSSGVPGVDTSGGVPGVDTGGGLSNPISANSIPEFVNKLIGIALQFLYPILVLMVIYTGFLFVKAQGNPEKLKEARQALLYTVIGAAIVLGAFVISELVNTTITNLTTKP